jgi:hypothetical protein
VGITTTYLVLLNKNHSKKRVALGKSAVLFDSSLDSADEVAARQNTINADGTAEGDATANEAIGARAFENLTDLENEEFIFVY